MLNPFDSRINLASTYVPEPGSSKDTLFPFKSFTELILLFFKIDILKKYLNGDYNLINSKLLNIKVGDNFNLPCFNNEKGIVNRISNNHIWIYLKSIGYSVKLKLA